MFVSSGSNYVPRSYHALKVHVQQRRCKSIYHAYLTFEGFVGVGISNFLITIPLILSIILVSVRQSLIILSPLENMDLFVSALSVTPCTKNSVIMGTRIVVR